MRILVLFSVFVVMKLIMIMITTTTTTTTTTIIIIIIAVIIIIIIIIIITTGEIMRRDHSSLSLYNMGLSSTVGKHSPPVSSSSAALALSTSAASAAVWGRGDAAAAAVAVAPSPPRSPHASPLSAAVGSLEKQKVGSLEKFVERHLMQPRAPLHLKGAMSHADLSSLSKQSTLHILPVRVHVPLILSQSTAEQFIDAEFHDRRKSTGSSGSDAPVAAPHPFKLSENSLGYSRGDAAAAAAAVVDAAVQQSSNSAALRMPKTIAVGGSDSRSSPQKHNRLNLDLICEPSILPLTCSSWPDPALLERNFKEIPSSRTSFIPAYENNISTLMSELICQRLAGDFQLLADASAKGDKNK